LQKKTNIPKQTTYRTLNELLEKGIIEKIISLPQQYKAIPFQDGLAMIASQKTKDYVKTMDTTKRLIEKFSNKPEKLDGAQEYTITVVEGKERLLKKTKTTIDNSNYNVDICTTLSRWVCINNEIYGTVEDALNRGVKFRAVLQTPAFDFCLPKELKSILTHSNYAIKLFSNQLKSNSAIFDNKLVSYNFYPSKTISESPMIWTNHTSFLVGSQLYFKYVWGKASDGP